MALLRALALPDNDVLPVTYVQFVRFAGQVQDGQWQELARRAARPRHPQVLPLVVPVPTGLQVHQALQQGVPVRRVEPYRAPALAEEGVEGLGLEDVLEPRHGGEVDPHAPPAAPLLLLLAHHQGVGLAVDPGPLALVVPVVVGPGRPPAPPPGLDPPHLAPPAVPLAHHPQFPDVQVDAPFVAPLANDR